MFWRLFILFCRFVREVTSTIERHKDVSDTTRFWMAVKTQVKAYSG